MSNNTTLSVEELPFSTSTTYLIAVLISLCILITVTGNLMVILAFITNKTIRNFSDFLVLNLAVSDFVIGLCNIPFYAPYLLLGKWPFGHAFCLVWLSMDYVTPAASAIGMSVISLDRYLHIGHPLWIRKHRTNGLLAVLLIIPWLLPALFFIPAIMLWEVGQGRVIPDGQCFLPYNQNVSMLMTGTIIEFIIPFIAVATFNLLVYIIIHKRNNKIKNAVRSKDGVTTKGLGNAGTTSAVDDSMAASLHMTRSKQQNSDNKAARALFILVFVFGICWCPFEMTALVQTICNGCVNLILFEVVFWMLWLNSLINPLLYPFLHTRYRRAFFRLIKYKSQSVGPSATDASTIVTVA